MGSIKDNLFLWYIDDNISQSIYISRGSHTIYYNKTFLSKPAPVIVINTHVHANKQIYEAYDILYSF